MEPEVNYILALRTPNLQSLHCKRDYLVHTKVNDNQLNYKHQEKSRKATEEADYPTDSITDQAKHQNQSVLIAVVAIQPKNYWMYVTA